MTQQASTGVPTPPEAMSDATRVAWLLERWDGSRALLSTRTRLDDSVVQSVHDVVSSLAGREIALEVRVLPTMDAGAVLSFGDAGRVVLDPRGAWFGAIARDLRAQIEAGEVMDADAAFGSLRQSLSGMPDRVLVEDMSDIGTVIKVGDGVAHVSGLRDVGSQELVEFEGGAVGIAFSLNECDVGVVLLDRQGTVREGAEVRRTNRPLQVPVGTGVIGRVIDALGRPLDGLGTIVPDTWLPAERGAPSVVDRQPVDTPLHSGIKVVDALVPIGRGQRELIIGDRKIGKTTIAVDTILAQRGAGVTCIYCAIGQKASTVRRIVATLEEAGAMAYTTVIAALPGEMPSHRYVAPFVACALGEYFLYQGGDALVVYDDLSKHAATYREISALLDRPVGREAYPGDIFYLHSRLLERAARLADEHGGGSLTAIPVAETLAGDISAFIPTNLISICDGQIVLSSDAFNAGRRPALDPGLSVSRVGGSAQAGSLKRVAGRLRIDLAQYEEMERFVKFGAEVDESTRRQLRRGERARALLRQPAHAPMALEAEVLVLCAVVSGLLDDTAVDALAQTEHDLVEWARVQRPEELDRALRGELSAEDADEALRSIVSAFLEASKPSEAEHSDAEAS
ncbi:MAG TPA: F0F1 ATP synthase subunit alpha [Coriobacteriia bacterium]|nr:F0F1 ATP synthase subunit alpha [Coriobacteriia bacterium]